MRFMWTPPAMWNHQSDGFEHWKLEHVSNYESKPKNLKLLKLEGVDSGSKIKAFYAPQFGVIGGVFLSFNVVYVTNITNILYSSCHVSKVVTCKDKMLPKLTYHCRIPIIQIGRHFTTTCRLLICTTQPQKSSMPRLSR